MRSPLLYVLLTAPLALAGKGSGNGHGNGNGNGSPCGKPPPIVTPNTVVLDGARMAQTKEAIRNLNPNGKRSSVHCRKTKPPPQSTCDLSTELDNLLLQADDWMSKGPWTVVSKTMSVPNGTAKDYASQAPYWWAANWDNPSSTEKCPYIQRDGIRNPEVDNYSDRRDGAAMMTSVYTLALAWWYTDNVAYRVHCADILRTWFINNGTRMTPNLRHAQIVPCQNDGRAIGIIDFSQQYTAVLDAAVLMATAEDASWGRNETQWFKDWNREFLTWLDESDFGKVEVGLWGVGGVGLSDHSSRQRTTMVPLRRCRLPVWQCTSGRTTWPGSGCRSSCLGSIRISPRMGRSRSRSSGLRRSTILRLRLLRIRVWWRWARSSVLTCGAMLALRGSE